VYNKLTFSIVGCTVIDVSNAFDPKKDASNIARHGISLARATEMVIARFRTDDRFDYGEVRYRAWGHIDGVAHCLVYTIRDGKVRPISLRRAHAKEMKRYVRQKET
jgi:uncharacterized DUF497 family protein